MSELHAPGPSAAPGATEPALLVRGLCKRYPGAGGQEKVALEDVSFSVAPGEVVALLGPNGAGKTTAMLLALGLLDADAGEVKLFGLPPGDLSVHRRLGFAPDAPLFPKALTGVQVLELHGALLGFSSGRARDRARELCHQLGLTEAGDRPCGVYSKGQLQRLGLAQALLGEPELLLLDEPTAGLDPAGVASMRELLLSLRARKVAVLLNSHLLSEVERVCDRVLFVRGGKVLQTHVVQGGARVAELRLANAAQVAPRLLPQMPEARLEGQVLRVPLAGEEVMPGLIKLVVGQGGELLEARLGGAQLEQLYLEIVEGRS